MTETHKPTLLKKGRWVGTEKTKGVAGFHLNELYSPWRSWAKVAEDFEKVYSDPQQYQVWVNTSLGKPFRDGHNNKLDWEIFFERSKSSQYKMGKIPEQCLLLTAGVDVQEDRLEASVFGWGFQEQSWLISHEIFLGNYLKDGVWKMLESFLSKTYQHPLGANIKVTATCIDTGYLTADVYNQVRSHKIIGWYAINISRPSWQEINYRGRVIKRGIQLYSLGVDKLKATLHARTKITKCGEKYINLPNDVSPSWCEGFCSEVKLLKYRSGQPYYTWQKLPGVDNEPLDCAVYALGAAHLAGVGRINWERQKIKMTVEKVPELDQQTKPTKPTKKKSPGNWVQNKL